VSLASDALARRIRPILRRKPEIVEKKMFGGIGFMFNGNMAVGTTAKGELLVRIDPKKRESALARNGAFAMSMGQRPMTGFVAVTSDVIDDPGELKAWVRYALDYASTLPPK
jgi:TfoX/Sxy family transcriptional regulator of competence genes